MAFSTRVRLNIICKVLYPRTYDSSTLVEKNPPYSDGQLKKVPQFNNSYLQN